VEKWKHSLHWRVGIKELAQLAKSFSIGKTYLRRFYFGSDYGSREKSEILVPFSRLIIEKAQMNRFEIVTKRVKYIHDAFGKSCIVFGARDHIGREVFDAKVSGCVESIFYVEDFEYRLSMNRQ
jgi:hypothetical protein